MQRRRADGKSVGKGGLGSAAVGSVVGASGSKALDLKDKKEKQVVVVAALAVISNATNKHLLQQSDTQNAARAIAMNLEVFIRFKSTLNYCSSTYRVTALIEATAKIIFNQVTHTGNDENSLTCLNCHRSQWLWKRSGRRKDCPL